VLSRLKFDIPELVGEILDGLPPEVFSSTTTTFLDPAMGGGQFVAEIERRLRAHGHSDANIRSRVFGYERGPVAIRYAVNKHNLVGNYTCKTIVEFLELNSDMQFDVVVGNPPYQRPDAGKSTGASALYHLFVEKSKQIGKTIALIIPSRWFAGGKGLDEFRETMLNDVQIRKIVDYPNSDDCFQNVFVAGGVCYFIWERDTNGDCVVVNRWEGKEAVSTRALNEFDKFVRFSPAVPVLKRVLNHQTGSIGDKISSRKPFGFPTNFKDFSTEQFSGAVKIYGNHQVGWIARDRVVVNTGWIDSWKVLIPAVGPNDSGIGKILAKPLVVEPNSCCTETYIVCGVFDTQQQAENLAAYIRTRFFRFMVSLRKLTQHNPRDRFLWVPDLSMDRTWTDQDLYQRYSLTADEIAYIEQTIHERV
jgi:site-specific DNA-methyltransferase (adenine-specific)